MSSLTSWLRFVLCSAALMAIALCEARAGDSVAGRTVFSGQCAGCHAVKAGQPSMGPPLSGIVGRKAGTVPGFKYSAAMKASGLIWDEATLDGFLAAPMKKVPGTSMPLGIASPKDRADVIAYLATLVSEKGALASPVSPDLTSAAKAPVVAGGPMQGPIISRP